MMINYLFIVLPLVYAFLYSRFWNKRLLESIIFGLTIFLGVNSFYFFVVSIFNFELNELVLFIVNVVYCLLIFLILPKCKNISGEQKKKNDYELMTIVTIILLSVLFILNLKAFNNGLRLPIPSYTEDASQHFHWVLNSLNLNKLPDGFYPFAFHGNAWLFISLATQIFGKTADIVFISNVFALYIWLIIFLTVSLISIIVYDLVNFSGRNNYILKVVIPIFVLILGSVVSIYFVDFGFFSNWLNQLFSLAIIYLLSRNSSKSMILFLPLIFGFFFSYSFFIPVLVLFFGYLYLTKKEPIYLHLSLISLFLSGIFLVELLFTPGTVGYLLTALGGYSTYTILTILSYITLSFFYYYSIKNKKYQTNTLEYLSKMGITFLWCAIGTATVQLILSGRISYSFHKIFASSFLFFGILATAGALILFNKVLSKNNNEPSSTYFFIKLTTLILCVMFFFNSINPFLVRMINGNGNFFSNNKEKFNGVIFALENFSNFINVIYIDGDYESTRWGTLSFLPTKFNVIYDQNNVTNFKNYDYYISQINDIDSNILILNPARFLEADCDSEGLIKVATKSADKVLVYPPLDLDKFRLNCDQAKTN